MSELPKFRFDIRESDPLAGPRTTGFEEAEEVFLRSALGEDVVALFDVGVLGKHDGLRKCGKCLFSSCC